LNIVTPIKLKIAPLNGRLNFPKHSLTWIVKGTFDLKVNGPAALAEEQKTPTGDEFYPDDEDMTGSPRYESDFAYSKLGADLLLVGACYAPNGQPAVSCPVTFRVGAKSKTVGVLGNRHWEKHWLTWKATEPEPFTRMELRYENSFGGAKFAANPVGKGFADEQGEAGEKVRFLPNVEDPAHQIHGHGDRPAPAGFGPLGRGWALRHGKLGTYKGAYRKTRWPWFPEDFDWTHFNAAPPDQQLEGYLRGDEPLVFENLHPRQARYESQLPGLRVRCFIHRLTDVGSRELKFDEIDMKLDTLWVDMEAEKLVLVWRGWTAVSSEDYEEIQDAFVNTEPLSQSPAPVEHHYRQFMALKQGEVKPFQPEVPPAAEPVEPAEVPDPAVAAAAQAAERQKEKEEKKKNFEALTAKLNAQSGFDQLPPEIQQQTRDQQAKLIERLSETDPAKSASLANEAEHAELNNALGKLGLDRDNLPPLTEKAQAEQERLMSELGMDHPDFQSDPRLAEMTAIIGAVFAKTAADPENLESVIAEVRKHKEKFGIKTEEEPNPVPDEAKVTPPPTRESVQAKVAEFGNFEGADLRGLDLSDLDLKNANFAGANLAGVKFHKSKLQQANFSKADLTGADLTEADLTQANAAAADFSEAKMCQSVLKEADLAGAKFARADLFKAVLDGAILEAADLTGANLAEASAIRTLFPRAQLADASFQKGIGVQADFSRATLSRANFQEANLTEAAVIGATGHQINLAGATFTKLRGAGCDFASAKMVEAKGNGSIWKGANLTGADLRYAQMQEAMFTAACLKQANLSAADLKFSRCNKADLTQAKMVKMNLFQGSLEEANLTQADCSGANMYEAEFLDAVLDRTVLEAANLIMTKLEPA